MHRNKKQNQKANIKNKNPYFANDKFVLLKFYVHAINHN